MPAIARENVCMISPTLHMPLWLLPTPALSAVLGLPDAEYKLC